jgi:pyrroloquinoline quinone (PQQ) biosynthesis protein C
MGVLESLDSARRMRDPLDHAFYKRWSAAEIEPQELTRYAGEYLHAVAAMAIASACAAHMAPAEQRASLREHAREEAAHLRLWRRFAGAAGANPLGSEPLWHTSRCVESWVAGDSVLDALAVLYVIEAGQPAISGAKLSGLIEHYGYTPDSPATEYFRVHQHLDVEHACLLRGLIVELVPKGRAGSDAEDQMLEHAAAALRGYWTLLDGVSARPLSVR